MSDEILKVLNEEIRKKNRDDLVKSTIGAIVALPGVYLSWKLIEILIYMNS